MENPSIQATDRKPRVESHSDLDIILVCWNNKDYLKPCLQSLRDGHLETGYRVVVVDNGSTDGSQAMLKEEFPDVEIIQNDKNVGLSRASNQGIEITQGKYVLLLNNDTLVDGSGLDTLVEYLDTHPETGAVGGKLLNPDGSFQAGYANFSTIGEEFLIATGIGGVLWPGYPSHKDVVQATRVDWMSSACLLLRRAALDRIGLLDEEYFIYGDEADLQYRLKKAGWECVYLPKVTTVHFGGRSMNRWGRRKMVYRGKLLFYKKNYGFFPILILRSMFFIISIIKLAIWAVMAIFPKNRERAQKEIKSNRDVVLLCFRIS